MDRDDEQPQPITPEASLAALYAADEAALKRVTLRTQGLRWGLAGLSLCLLAAPLLVASIFMNMDSTGAGHVVGLVGMFSGFFGAGCFVASLAALVEAWRGGRRR